MKIKQFCLIATIILTTACASTKKTLPAFGKTNSYPTAMPKPTDDGLSYATAIVITETSESTGPHAEYLWIKQHYSNYKVKGQSLVFENKKPYDIIAITFSDDKKLDLYFDISNYFGKF